MLGIWDYVALALSACLAILMGAAAVIDAQTRRFPNPLALAMAAVSLALCFLLHPGSVVALRLCVSLVLLTVLYAFERAWRRLLRTEGLGMGDAKALAIAALVAPGCALLAFCLSLFALAVICMVRRLRSMPLLPLFYPIFAVMVVAFPAVWPRLQWSCWI